MKKILALFLLLNINIFSADDCGVNIYNVATGKLHKRFVAAEQAHLKNKKIVSERCVTEVEKNEYDMNSFNIVAICEFEIGDKIFNRRTNNYEAAEGVGKFIASYSYNMFAYEIFCGK